MKYKNKIISFFSLLILAFAAVSCQTQQAGNGNAQQQQQQQSKPTVKAESPTAAYRMLYAAVKAKDSDTIKGLMSKGSLGLAGMSAGQQKKPLEQILENGLVAPTLATSITEIRDERIKENFGRIEVYNEKEQRWEDLPFILEDGSWKLAVGDLFAGTFDPKNTLPKGKAQIETEASNKMMPVPSNTVPNFPEMNANGSAKVPPISDKTKSVEVPKEDKPKK
jgi:hypothetical protein